MRMKIRTRRLLVISSLSIITVLLFQNCSPTDFKVEKDSQENNSSSAIVEATPEPTPAPKSKTCEFQGAVVQNGSSVLAFLSSTVAFATSCQKEQRVCDNGKLSGTYGYSKCAVASPATCMFDGKKVGHGEIALAFQLSAVGFGKVCVSQTRKCSNGSLSGSFEYSLCAVDQPKACLFNGKTIAHQVAALSYKASSVPYGSLCEREFRTCKDGILSGGYEFSNCAASRPASCLFADQTIVHGRSVTAFKDATVPYDATCQQQARSCINGVLSNTYANPSCSILPTPPCLFAGSSLAEGAKITAYHNIDGQCKAQTRLCTNKKLSGSFEYSSCATAKPNTLLYTREESGVTLIDLSKLAAAKQTPVREVLKREFDAIKIAPLDPLKDIEVFSTYSLTGNSIYNQNNYLGHLDFSGVAWDSVKCGTLITRQHAVLAAHYQRSVGEKVIYHDKFGRPVVRTITAMSKAIGDITVIKLNAPVPETVAVYALLDGVSDLNIPSAVLDQPYLVTNQFRRVFYHRIGYVRYGSISGKMDADNPNMAKFLIKGDSGNPAFIVVEGRLVLMSTHSTASYGNGPFYGDPNVIAGVIAAIKRLP